MSSTRVSFQQCGLGMILTVSTGSSVTEIHWTLASSLLMVRQCCQRVHFGLGGDCPTCPDGFESLKDGWGLPMHLVCTYAESNFRSLLSPRSSLCHCASGILCRTKQCDVIGKLRLVRHSDPHYRIPNLCWHIVLCMTKSIAKDIECAFAIHWSQWQSSQCDLFPFKCST